MVTVEELQAKCYLELSDPLWGQCIVVPSAEFSMEMEGSLVAQGLRCHYTTLEGHAAVFVQLKRSAAIGKTVYVPLTKSESVVHGNSLEVKKVENKDSNTEKSLSSLKGPAWTSEDEQRLLKRYHEIEAQDGQSLNHIDRVRKLLPEFSDRNESSVNQKARKLLRKEAGGKKRGEDSVKTVSVALEMPTELKRLAELLQKLSADYVVLKAEFEQLRKDSFVEYSLRTNVVHHEQRLDSQTECIANLNRDVQALAVEIKKHKHAQGSGEAMLPMEAAS